MLKKHENGCLEMMIRGGSKKRLVVDDFARLWREKQPHRILPISSPKNR